MKRIALALLVLVAAVINMGDSCGSPPPVPPAVGFAVHTEDQLSLFYAVQDTPYVSVTGNWTADSPPLVPYGFILWFSGTTDAHGFLGVPDGKAPAYWNFLENSGPCKNKTARALVARAQTQDLLCVSATLSFTMTPTSLDAGNIPSSVQIVGSGITTAYGMPHVQLFNDVGTNVSEVVATSVTNSGTVLIAPSPNLAGLTSGTYGIRVMNVQSDQTLSPAGALAVGIYGTEPRIPYLALTPLTLNFGTLFYGDSPKSLTVAVKNNGSSTINVSSIGANLSGPWSSTNNCSSTLVVGAGCSITVTFDPGDAPNGRQSAVLSVVDTATNSPQTVNLNATMSCPDGYCP